MKKNMCKIVSIIICFFLVGCITTSSNEDFNESEYRKASPKDIIKDDAVYFAMFDYAEDKKRLIDYYDSIEESVYNQHGNSEYGYSKQLIYKMIHKFEYDNGVIEIVYLSKKTDKSDVYLYRQVIYSKKNKGNTKYSHIMTSIEPVKLKKTVKLFQKLGKYDLLYQKINNIQLPVKNEPNKYYGYTTDKERVNRLKIEGQKPDEIKEFEVNGIKYYFWYYNDLKTDKEVDKYKIEY